ncbi:dipeptidase [Propionicicella superfundia]|uniref:dipeptidase n=1 Tax=Propionicicella superfundia TaxID=348582 RepID=UPI000403C5CF|nr:dipeptidase [Propionicicella superfundia]
MIPVIDGHNDLAWHRRNTADYSVERLDAESAATLHTDIPKMRRGGLQGQFWSVYVHTDLSEADRIRGTLEQIDFVRRLAARYPDVFARTVTADDVERAMAAGRIASLMGVEGSHQIGGSFAVLRSYARLGVRYMTLTWNLTTEFADANVGEPVHGGLSDRGRELVAEMNRLGMLVDLSHVSAATMRDALRASRLPVIFSHSSCFALNPHPRNVPDDVLTGLATNGGVQMITFVPHFVSTDYWEWEKAGSDGPAPRVTLPEVVAHIEHAREVMGIDHIGLGGDYDGFDAPGPEGLEDVSRYPALFAELRDRGWSDDDLHRLGHRNILRVLHDNDAALRTAADLA